MFFAMRKKLLVVVAVFALALCIPAMAFAANSAFDKGTAESTSYVDSYTGNAYIGWGTRLTLGALK